MNQRYKGKNWRNRLVCLLLAMALISPGLGAEAESLSTKYMYTTTSNVMLRPKVDTSDYIDRLPANWPMQRLRELTVNNSVWYEVKVKGTPTFPKREETGYVNGAYVRMMTSAEETAYLSGATILPGEGGNIPLDPSDQSGYVKLTKHNVNLRRTPGGESMTQVPNNTILPFYGAPTSRAGYQWVYVLYNGIWGYVRGDCYIFTDSSGKQVPMPTGLPTLPPSGATEAPVSGTETIRLTKAGVNLRKTPGGVSLLQMARGLTLAAKGTPVSYGGYLWIYAKDPATGTWGYVRNDCYEYVSSGGGTTPTAPPSGTIGYIITTIGSLNVRTAPSMSATTFTQLPKSGVSFPYKGMVSGGGRQWYHIIYNGRSAYILSTYARVSSTSPTTTPGVGPTPTVNPADLSSTAVTTMENVLVRGAGNASGKVLTKLYKLGSVAKLTGQTTSSGGYTWRQVTTSGVTGWIRGDLLRILTKTEEAQLNNTGDPNLPQEATYRTLRRGDKGEDVTRLQTELSRLGFLPANAVTGVYTDQTVEAVKAYQKAAGSLAVDGVAGPLTQHRLYGTVPPGTNNPGGTVDPNMYAVEKENWSVVNTVWKNGVTAVLTDVKTGLSFRARRWAGKYHADVEPLTAADTVVMCRIYGVSKSQDIADKNLYQRKPFWVTVNGHTYAASVYGVPHNYPDGDTIPDNAFSGQFCVHFVGSYTHSKPNGPADPDHQKAIQEAYDKAPNKK